MVDLQWNDETEDWPKRSWDFHDHVTGAPIDTLDDLVAATGRTPEALIHDLLHLPFGKAAPPKLIEEARRRAHA